jgi:hypothetical protein
MIGAVSRNNNEDEPVSTSTNPQLVEPPASVTGGTQYQQLAYVDAYDAVLNCDYAFVAYKETDSGGEWRVRIKSSQTAGAVFEPAFRVHVQDGQPHEIEMLVQLRKFDGTADSAKSVKFAWPA